MFKGRYMTATFCLNNFYYCFLISGILFSILYIFLFAPLLRLPFLCHWHVYMLLHLLYILYLQLFLQHYSNCFVYFIFFFIRPAPKNTDNLPICSASILVIYPSFHILQKLHILIFKFFWLVYI